MVSAPTVERKDIEARGYDLKAVNPHAKRDEDTRTPWELLDVIEAKGREVADAITTLRRAALKGPLQGFRSFERITP